MKISILGMGTFGGAMASHLERKGHKIESEVIFDSDIVLVATPSYAVISALVKEKNNIKNQKIIVCSKGFCENGELLSEGLKKEFTNDIFFLYGPTLASGITNGDLSAMVLAGGEGKEEIKKEIESKNLRIELSDDIIGVQVGAALKNVVTIFVGIAEGAGYNGNTQAFIFTKGLQEIQKIGIALGAKANTFLGLTCVGDLTLHSRNRQLGIELGKGRILEDIVKDMGYTPEGLTALKNAKGIACKLCIEVPFIKDLFSLVFEGKPIKEAIEDIKYVV